MEKYKTELMFTQKTKVVPLEVSGRIRMANDGQLTSKLEGNV